MRVLCLIFGHLPVYPLGSHLACLRCGAFYTEPHGWMWPRAGTG